MAALALFGAVMGLIAAFLATRKKKHFKKHLLGDLERHLSDGTARDYVFWAVGHKAQWEKPLSVIRKPFKEEINLFIETGAFILALLGLITALTSFDKAFKSMSEGAVVLVFLGMVLSFIPCERFLDGRIEAEIEETLNELKDAAKEDELESYITEARRSWS